MKINWKQKLSSRKFWALIIALVISLLILFGFQSTTQENITALIGAFGSVVIYMLAESRVDIARTKDE